jgi:hypothetical protein
MLRRGEAGSRNQTHLSEQHSVTSNPGNWTFMLCCSNTQMLNRLALRWHLLPKLFGLDAVFRFRVQL